MFVGTKPRNRSWHAQGANNKPAHTQNERDKRLKDYQKNRGCPTRLSFRAEEPEIRWLG